MHQYRCRFTFVKNEKMGREKLFGKISFFKAILKFCATNKLFVTLSYGEIQHYTMFFTWFGSSHYIVACSFNTVTLLNLWCCRDLSVQPFNSDGLTAARVRCVPHYVSGFFSESIFLLHLHLCFTCDRW